MSQQKTKSTKTAKKLKIERLEVQQQNKLGKRQTKA